MTSHETTAALEETWRIHRRRIDALLADEELHGGQFLTGFKSAYYHAVPKDSRRFNAIYQEGLADLWKSYQEVQTRGQALSVLHLHRDHSKPSTSRNYSHDTTQLLRDLRHLLERMETYATALRPHVPREHQPKMDEPFASFSTLAAALIGELEGANATAKRMNAPQSLKVPNGIKQGYKQTEIGVIPEDWRITRCEDIADRIMVGIVIRPTQYYVRQGIPALRSANIREEGIVDDDLVYISAESNTLLSKSQTRAGDVLTVRTGYPGTSAVVNSDRSGWNCIDILITRPSKHIVSDFLSRWINSPLGKEQVLRNQGGLAQKHFNVGDMCELLVALPPLSEQRAIAEALGDVDGLLRALDRLIAKKRDLKQAAMQQLLTGKTRLPGFKGGWIKKDLGKLAQPRKERINPRRSADSHFCVELENLASGSGVLLDATTAGQSISLKTVFKEGDVLFGKLRAYLRKYWFANRSGVCSTEIWALVAGTELLSQFLFQLVQTNEFIDAASNAYGTHMPRSDWKVVRELAVSVPPLPEQIAIAEVLNDMDAELETLEARREKTRALKKGMMQELLTGRTRLV